MFRTAAAASDLLGDESIARPLRTNTRSPVDGPFMPVLNPQHRTPERDCPAAPVLPRRHPSRAGDPSALGRDFSFICVYSTGFGRRPFK